MEGNIWRPSGEPSAIDSSSGDWRSGLMPDAREIIVNKIMDTLKRHLPISGPEGLTELKKIAVRFEEKIYTSATSHPDYLQKISQKMLAMETKTPVTTPSNQSLSNLAFGNQTPAELVFIYSTAQTGHAGTGDCEEAIYQKIKSMKDSYFAEVSEIHRRVSLEIQQHEALGLPAKPPGPLEKLKHFKFMLERMLAFLQMNKSEIPPNMNEKLPLYEKQITNFVVANRSKKTAPLLQPQGQQQFQMPPQHLSMTASYINQFQQMNLYDP